jgi:hypothetical protein
MRKAATLSANLPLERLDSRGSGARDEGGRANESRRGRARQSRLNRSGKAPGTWIGRRARSQFSGRTQRDAAKARAAEAGAASRLYRLACADEVAWRCIEQRNGKLDGSLLIAKATFERLKSRFEPLHVMRRMWISGRSAKRLPAMCDRAHGAKTNYAIRQLRVWRRNPAPVIKLLDERQRGRFKTKSRDVYNLRCAGPAPGSSRPVIDIGLRKVLAFER